jgi:hypothetical protein
MRAVFLLTSVIILFFSSLAQAAPTSSDTDAQNLIAKSKSVLEALQNKDVQSLNELLTDDFRRIDVGGSFSSRQETLGTAREGFLKAFLFYTPQAIRIDNDSILVTYNAVITLADNALKQLADDNITWPRYSKVSDLWVRQGGDWKLKFQQITPVLAMY